MTWKSALSLVLGLLLVGCGASEAADPAASTTKLPRVQVTLATAVVADVTQSLDLVGNLVPRQRTTIVTEVDGVVRSMANADLEVERHVDGVSKAEAIALGLGQEVQKDDVLVQIDQRDYRLALEASEAALAAAEMDLAVLRAWHRPEEIRRLRALRDQAASRVELAALDLQRVEQLREDEIVSQSEHDQAKSAHDVAKAVLDGAEAALFVATSGPTDSEVARAEARIAQAQAEVAIRQDQLDRTTIRAPFDGVITERYVDVGERVTAMPRVEILEITDSSLVFVEVGVPERHVHQVALRDPVHVRLAGVSDPVPGTVVRVNDKIDRGSRTYRVRVVVDNPERRYKPGQFVHVAFALRASDEHPVVPARAITYGGGQPQVFVCADGRVSLVNVRLGLSDGARTQVLEGLDAGDRVVVDDPAVLSDGMRVEVGEDVEPAR